MIPLYMTSHMDESSLSLFCTVMRRLFALRAGPTRCFHLLYQPFLCSHRSPRQMHLWLHRHCMQMNMPTTMWMKTLYKKQHSSSYSSSTSTITAQPHDSYSTVSASARGLCMPIVCSSIHTYIHLWKSHIYVIHTYNIHTYSRRRPGNSGNVPHIATEQGGGNGSPTISMKMPRTILFI